MAKLGLSIAAPLATLLFSSCAQQPQAGMAAARAPRQCFFAGQVNDFSAAGDTAVNIRAGTNSFYRLDLVGACTDINWTNSVALRTRSGGSSICDPADAELFVPGRLGGRCLVSAITPITREQWLANTRR